MVAAGLPQVAPGPPARPVVLRAELASYQSATVSGTVTVSPSWAYPGSENKDQQDFACSGSANIVDVRVEGTDISSPVTATGSSCTFSLSGVPTGTVTLLAEAQAGTDAYQEPSLQKTVSVPAGGLSGADINLQFKWQTVALPASLSDTGGASVSAKDAFFLNATTAWAMVWDVTTSSSPTNGANDCADVLYHTTDGTTWSAIASWPFAYSSGCSGGGPSAKKSSASSCGG